LDKISQVNFVETVSGSSYTQAALSKMIVVDHHIQAPKSAEKGALITESRPAAAQKQVENAASSSEKKSITK